jgi:hypothetical protein
MQSGSKQTLVGHFFERVCQQILGGDLCRNQDGDICLWDLETTVEVKSSGAGSSYGFRLDIKQIETYENLSKFPFTTALYALFSYTNKSVRVDGRRCTELSQHITAETVHSYLAKAVERCVIVDLSIVQRWNALFPKSRKSILGHLGTETVDIKCRSLDSFTVGPLGNQLRLLDLDPSEYRILAGNVSVKLDDCHQLLFPITIVLRKKIAAALHRKLRSQGMTLKSSLPA